MPPLEGNPGPGRYLATMSLAQSVPAMPNPMTAMAGQQQSLSKTLSIRNRGRLWTPDRGPGFYQTQRERQNSPSLITTGKYVFVHLLPSGHSNEHR